MSQPVLTSEIVITGVGICTPLGPDRDTTWRCLLTGESGLDWFDESRRWAGGKVPGFDQRVLPVTELSRRVAAEAWADSRLDQASLDPARLGVVFGTSKGELQQLLAEAPHAQGSWLDGWPATPAARLADQVGALGPVLCPVAACATGLAACIRAADLIADDVCDVVLAGSADASLFPAVLGSYQRLGVLAKISGSPAEACRPFDRRRSGFVIGEGAACLILERRSHAAARGAMPVARWLGGRLASDCSGMTQCDPEARSLTRVLTDLVRRLPSAPDYVNLHGTATRQHDPAECLAVRTALGPAARSASCSGLKGSLGHLLGAAGSVELALTVLAVRDQIVPPTINLTDPDPGCSLDLTPGVALRRDIDIAVKISSGFGGHLAVAALGRADL